MKIQIEPFNALSAQALYDILRLRSAVFVVEQTCIYQDLDNLDPKCIHVYVEENEQIVAYARILPPGLYYTEASIGRVVTARNVRKKGLGKKVFEIALAEAQKRYPTSSIRIMAQSYLIAFYQSFGFEVVSEPFLEDGIPHVEMLLTVNL